MAKSAAERAQENVDLGTAKVARLQKQLDGIKPKYDKVTAELAEAKTDLEFAKKHPALEGGAAQPKTTVEADEAEVAEPDGGTPEEAPTAGAHTKKAAAQYAAPVEGQPAPTEQASLIEDDPFAN